jgi:triacylglycerol lipase
MADVNRLLRFAKISNISYLMEAEAAAKFKELGFDVVKFFDRKGAQAYLVENDMETVLVFRGTEITQASDIKADLDIIKNKTNDGRIHKGFKKELEKIWKEITPYIERNKKTLSLTGHSLGAAMATIAASHIEEKVSELVTFGSPRVGNRKFVKCLSVSHFRVKNNNDVVTKIPLFIMGYRHHSAPIYLNYYGEIRKLTTFQIMKDMMRSKFRAWQKGQMFSGAYDHSMENYISKLEAINEKEQKNPL